MRFLESIGHYSDKEDLCLKDFSKSLSSQVYTWYVGLKLGTIRD